MTIPFRASPEGAPQAEIAVCFHGPPGEEVEAFTRFEILPIHLFVTIVPDCEV
ncbi:MAG: hypothetical protein ACYTFG_00245 [Planctomycetota bacterium]|jgi:hypothetical protein